MLCGVVCLTAVSFALIGKKKEKEEKWNSVNDEGLEIYFFLFKWGSNNKNFLLWSQLFFLLFLLSFYVFVSASLCLQAFVFVCLYI